MSLFMTSKKREKINDEIDDLLMEQYYCRCRIEDATETQDEQSITHENAKIDEYELRIEKLRKKLR